MRTSVRSTVCSSVRSLILSSGRPFVGSSVSSSVRPSVRPRGRRRAWRERRGTLSQAAAAAGAGIQTFVAIFATAITLSGAAAALLWFSVLRSNRQMGPRQMHVVASGSGACFVHSSSSFPLCTSSSSSFFSLSHFSPEEVERRELSPEKPRQQ
jgi:hypothetical protein